MEDDSDSEVPEARYLDSDESSAEEAILDSDDSDYELSVQRAAKKKAARARKAAVRPPIANAQPGPSSGKKNGASTVGQRFEEEKISGVKKSKVKTRNEATGMNEDAPGDLSDVEGEISGLDGLTFKVSKRVYNTFEQYLGAGSIQRTDVAWVRSFFFPPGSLTDLKTLLD